MSDTTTRVERDTMGEMEVPADAYYGASTQRAVINFPISGIRVAAAVHPRARADQGRRGAGQSRPRDCSTRTWREAIAQAAQEVADGKLDAHFPIDVFQTGSGHLDEHERQRGDREPGRRDPGRRRAARAERCTRTTTSTSGSPRTTSSRPRSTSRRSWRSTRSSSRPSRRSARQLAAKSEEFWGVIKTGRTHLQDATPIRMGQVFLGYAGQMEQVACGASGTPTKSWRWCRSAAPPSAPASTRTRSSRRGSCAIVSKEAGVDVRETDNHFQAQATIDAVVEASGSIRTIAVSLLKIANDIRLMGSGPRCGLGELALPEVQPGSSIMPGKVNPVIAESLIQAASQSIANDVAVLQAGQWSFFELNTMLPFAAHNLVQSIEILAAATTNFAERCVRGLEATERGPEMVERGLAICTGLVPLIGYDAAAAIAKEAAKIGPHRPRGRARGHDADRRRARRRARPLQDDRAAVGDTPLFLQTRADRHGPLNRERFFRVSERFSGATARRLDRAVACRGDQFEFVRKGSVPYPPIWCMVRESGIAVLDSRMSSAPPRPFRDTASRIAPRSRRRSRRRAAGRADRSRGRRRGRRGTSRRWSAGSGCTSSRTGT